MISRLRYGSVKNQCDDGGPRIQYLTDAPFRVLEYLVLITEATKLA